MKKEFYINFIDRGGCEINPSPQLIYALNLGHAMQKAVAIIPDDTEKVII